MPVYVVKMVHTRETRASASEIKFVIDSSPAPRVSAWARKHLKADPHGSGPFQDEYETSSLYFDTRDFDVFPRRHAHGRAKYRVRRYGDSDAATRAKLRGEEETVGPRLLARDAQLLKDHLMKRRQFLPGQQELQDVDAAAADNVMMMEALHFDPP